MIPTDGLTPTQQSVLDVLNGPRPYPPTVRELAAILDCSTSNAYAHLLMLRRKGMVEWEPGKPRTLRVVNMQ
jgi:SOS-response transcriptional repressor LexA